MMSPEMTELFEAYSAEPDERFRRLLLGMVSVEAGIVRDPDGGDYRFLRATVLQALRMKNTYVMPPQQVTLTPATIEAIVERVAERNAPTNPKIAYISVDGAESVADHLHRAIETTCPTQLTGEWHEVYEALRAIATDTDQIRTHK